jgi:AraC-like DNA-binding protein
MTGPNVLIAAIIIVLVITFVVTMLVVNAHIKKIIDDNDQLAEKHHTLLEQNEMQGSELEEHKMELKEKKEMIEMLRKQQKELVEQLNIISVDKVTVLQEQTREHREHIELTSDMSDEQLMAWVDQRMDETRLFANPTISLKDIASAMGLTQRRLANLFKQHEKYANLNEYLSEKRFLLACQLMRENPQWKIEAVAMEAGFQTRRTFQEVVKSHLGLTPSQFRQMLASEVSDVKNEE